LSASDDTIEKLLKIDVNAINEDELTDELVNWCDGILDEILKSDKKNEFIFIKNLPPIERVKWTIYILQKFYKGLNK
jgi:hypothetical protein